MVAEVPHLTAGTVKLVASPIPMSETPCKITGHPSLLGEHTEQVLREVLGYTPEQINDLQAKGAI